MKKIIYFFTLAALLISCAKDETVSLKGNYTITGFVSQNTKTHFGTPDEDSKTIPFLWSEGDEIWSGNSKSTSINILQEGLSAEFTLSSEPQDGSMVYYNMTGSQERNVVLPHIQDISNSLGLNGDFGYGTVRRDGSFSLIHTTSYLIFDLELFEGASLSSIIFDAGENTIAGSAQWRPENNDFTYLPNTPTTITLNNDNNVVGKKWSMVIFPKNLTGSKVKVIYKIKVDNVYDDEYINSHEYYEYHIQELDGIELEQGKTYIISNTIDKSNAVSTEEYTQTKTLTFEDDDAQFDYIDLGYFADWDSGMWNYDYCAYTWSELIDPKQYYGYLLYGNSGNDAMYWWVDTDNTELRHDFPDNGGSYCFWGGGHAISNYVGAGYSDDDRNPHIINFYGEDYIEQWQGIPGADSGLGWFLLQLMVPIEPHSGDNFAVHYGYKDFFNKIENLPELYFDIETNNVIDHMYVTNTNYTLNQLYNGVKSEEGNTFGGNWTGLTDNAWLKITVQGFEKGKEDYPVREVHFYLVKGQNVVETWEKFNMAPLGPIYKARFNFAYSAEMGGKYGFTIPGYFAYDDVCVRLK